MRNWTSISWKLHYTVTVQGLHTYMWMYVFVENSSEWSLSESKENNNTDSNHGTIKTTKRERVREGHKERRRERERSLNSLLCSSSGDDPAKHYVITSVLLESLTTPLTLHPRMGEVIYFEHQFTNWQSTAVSVSIHWEDPCLKWAVWHWQWILIVYNGTVKYANNAL